MKKREWEFVWRKREQYENWEYLEWIGLKKKGIMRIFRKNGVRENEKYDGDWNRVKFIFCKLIDPKITLVVFQVKVDLNSHKVLDTKNAKFQF